MSRPQYTPYTQRHGSQDIPVLSEEARQAIIEHRRTMKDVRQWQAANRERIDAEWAALTSPPRTIEEHVAPLRDGDPDRWQQLQSEWARELNAPVKERV